MNIPNELKDNLGASFCGPMFSSMHTTSMPIFHETPLVVDVGQHRGGGTPVSPADKARVLSIEAIAETYSQLQQNCSSYAHITTVHQAVGASTGTTRLYRYPLAPGLGGLASSRAHIWAALSKQALQQITWGSAKEALLSPFRVLGALLWSLFAMLIVSTRRQQECINRRFPT